MKKFKYLLVIPIILLGIVYVINIKKSSSYIDDSSKNYVKSNMLSMMLETDAGTGKYELSSSNSWQNNGYIFNSELSKCENGSTLSWDDANKQVTFSGNVTDKCYVYFDKYNPKINNICTNNQTLSSCITAFGNLGTNISNIYIHDSNLENGAGDNSYRYAGANPDNYVCFGSDDATCPYENLYRIIGVIDDRIKLVSADGATTYMLGTDGGYYTTYKDIGGDSTYYKGTNDLSKMGVYYWGTKLSSKWSTSNTNAINLNTNFLTFLDKNDSKWTSMLDDTTWYVGGMTNANGIYSDAKTAYNYEVGANKDTSTTVTSKVGMIYLSDYYYGSISEYWTLPGFSNDEKDYRKSIDDNWLYIGLYEWTISVVSDGVTKSYNINVNGYVNRSINTSIGTSGYVVRPCFFLTTTTKYISGSGTSSDPIRVG